MPRTRTKPLIPGRTEKQVTAAVLDAALMLGLRLERRNVGAFTNPAGRMVRCGEAGDPDWSATLPGGRTCLVEIKKESFDPSKVRGNDKIRFEAQLEKLREVNRLGGVGMWTRDGGDFLAAMRRVLAGWRVEIDDKGWCFVTDEPRETP